MKTASLIALAILLAPVVGRAELAVDEDDQVITHDCAKDPTIWITSNNNKIKATGPCKNVALVGNNNQIEASSVESVDISGNDNEVKTQATNRIRVSGNDNTVRYKRAIAAKRRTAVLDSGDDNSIKRVE